MSVTANPDKKLRPVMQLQFLKSYAVVCAIPTVLVFATSLPKNAHAFGSEVRQYCNQQYACCVSMPASGKAEPHERSAPNHGIIVDMPGLGNQVWTFAHWDAGELGGSPKAAIEEAGMILDQHPDAMISIKPAMLSGLSGYRIHVTYLDNEPMEQEIIVAYRKPKQGSKDVVGITMKSE